MSRLHKLGIDRRGWGACIMDISSIPGAARDWVDGVKRSWGPGLFYRPQEDNIVGREQNGNESQRP